MEKIQIKDRWDSVIYEYECEDNTIKKTVENAVKSRADLHEANLSRADLHEADLHEANLSRADLHEADLYGANLYGADLYGADLHGANLYEANLTRANLYEANLSRADLTRADLHEADLYGANLYGAEINKSYAYYIIPDFYILKMQAPDTKLKAWKYLSDDGGSPVQNKNRIFYEVGKTYSESECDENELNLCGKGLNVATLQWCLKGTIYDDTPFIEVEFEAKDIIAIPFFTDGKFRVKKLTVLRKTTRAKALKELLKLTKWNKYFKERE